MCNFLSSPLRIRTSHSSLHIRASHSNFTLKQFGPISATACSIMSNVICIARLVSYFQQQKKNQNFDLRFEGSSFWRALFERHVVVSKVFYRVQLWELKSFKSKSSNNHRKLVFSKRFKRKAIRVMLFCRFDLAGRYGKLWNFFDLEAFLSRVLKCARIA